MIRILYRVEGRRVMKRKAVTVFVLALAVLIPLSLFWYHSSHTRDIEPAPPNYKTPPKSRVQKNKREIQATAPVTKESEVVTVGKEKVETSTAATISPADLRYLGRKGILPRLIHIPDGDRGTIFASLRRQGLPLWISDRYILLPSRIEPGWIRLERSISLKEFFSKINEFPREKTRRVVMYSGDSLDDFVQRFSSQTRLPVNAIFEEYFRFSPYIDGGILAGYYRLPYRLTPGPALAYLTEKSETTFSSLAKKRLGSYDPPLFKRYLIVASIIQRESWRPEEMGKISAVIYNRLRRGMKLQMDATLNYGPYSHRIVTPERIRHDSSRFNTYRYKGLPPEPLGSVTVPALEAAFKPADTQAIYFVRNTMGWHEFSNDYAEHLARISRIKAERAKLDLYKKEWEKMRERIRKHKASR